MDGHQFVHIRATVIQQDKQEQFRTQTRMSSFWAVRFCFPLSQAAVVSSCYLNGIRGSEDQPELHQHFDHLKHQYVT